MKKEAVGIEDENEYCKGIIDGDYATFFAPQPMYSFFNAEKENEILSWHSLPFGIITNKNIAESNIGHIKRFSTKKEGTTSNEIK